MKSIPSREVTLNLRDTALLSMVIPLRCSSSLLSRYLNLPAIFEEIMLLAARRESMRVVLPWSTWPRVVIMRTFSGSSMAKRVTTVNRSDDNWCILHP